MMYPDVIGGGEISAYHIAKCVSERIPTVVVCLSERLKEPVIEKDGNLTIYRFPWNKSKYFPRLSNLEYCYWQIYKAIKKVIKIEKPDGIHFLNFGSIHPVALLFRKVPTFATCNGPWFCTFGGYHHGKSCMGCSWKEKISLGFNHWRWKFPVYLAYTEWSHFLLKTALRICKCVVPVSTAMKSMLSKYGVKDRCLRVIHNPVPVLKSKKKNEKKKVYTLLYAGRLSEDKGIHTVIKSLTFLNNVHFIIAGKGSYREELERLASALGVSQRVHFKGFLNSEQLEKVFLDTDILVNISLFFEPLSRSVIEAASRGIPAIVTNVGGNSETVLNGKTGIILENINPETIVNAINTIINGKHNLGWWSKNAILFHSEQFTPEKISSEYVEMYEQKIVKNTHQAVKFRHYYSPGYGRGLQL